MPRTTKSVPCIGDTPRGAAPPHDLHDETHEGESSEASEQFSDEDSDYGNRSWISVLQCVYTYNFCASSEKNRKTSFSEEDEKRFS